MNVKQVGVLQADGTYSYEEIGVDAENVDIDSTRTLADKITDWDNKVDSEEGKGLSTNDYTTIEKDKLGGVAENAEVNTIESISINGIPQTPDDYRNVDLQISTPTNVAPTNHASSTTTYGQATESNYGHAKISDVYNSAVTGGNAAGGMAASQNALANAYNTLNINKLSSLDNVSDDGDSLLLTIDEL